MNKTDKTRAVFFVKAVACAMVFVLALQYGTTLVRERRAGPMDALYRENRNSIDALFVGSSHVYHNINTPLLWQKYGIAGFNAAGPTQPLWASYYYIKEACESQSPKVVVVDVLSVSGYWKDEFYDNQDAMRNQFRKNVQNVRGFANRTRMIVDCIPREEWFSYWFDLVQYHNRTLSLNEVAFCYRAELDYQKGFNGVSGQKPPAKITDVSGVKDTSGLSPKHKEYVDKIIALSREKGFSLLFVNAPYVFDVYRNFPPADQMRFFNELREMAAEQGVPFIDFNTPAYSCGIDWKTDTYDFGSHLNFKGAEKYTNALGKYLKKHYDLPDRRGDPDYASWDEAYVQYVRLLRLEQLKQSPDVASYLQGLRDPDYLTIFTMSGKTVPKPAAGEPDPFVQLDLKLPDDTKSSFLAVVDNGAPAYMQCGEGVLEYFSEDSGVRIHASSMGSQPAGGAGKGAPASSVYLDCKQYSKNKTGLNIVVFDKKLHRVVDQCWIAPGKTFKIAR